VQESQLYKVHVITGPTGSGKTYAGIEFAKSRGDVELINCDTVQFYRHFNIGAAKGDFFYKNFSETISNISLIAKGYNILPKINVWFLDDLDADQSISSSIFQTVVRQLIQRIKNRGNLPVLIGGSGYYLQSVLFNYEFNKFEDDLLEFDKLTLEQLKEQIIISGYDLSSLNHSDQNNPRRLINILRRRGNHRKYKNSKKFYDFTLQLLLPEISELEMTLKSRVEQMFQDGFIDECKMLWYKYGSTLIPNLRNAVGYKQVFDMISSSHNVELEILKEMVYRSHRQLAKKQITWFKKYLQS
jgi:tRNA dimethylallyltransferase